MLAVKKDLRGKGIGQLSYDQIEEYVADDQTATNLVERAIRKMIDNNADEVVLETEITNPAAMKLYENLGFLRSKRLYRYYLNANDAFRYKLNIK